MATFAEELECLERVSLRVVGISNPHCWYKDALGTTLDAVWFANWGCYIVPARAGMHPDDMCIRPLDVITV